MKEHTRRILERMLLLLTKYEGGDSGLEYLVNSLEGSLSAIEEKLPREFYDSWYEHWGELETYLALSNEEDNQSEILEETKALETQIRQILEE